MPVRHEELLAVSAYIAEQGDVILQAWRRKVAADPHLTTGSALPTAQLNDHLPALLEDFVRRLGAADGATRAASEEAEQSDAAAHGLHRWQQGFDLLEVSRELGRFNECVVAALEGGAAPPAALSPAALAQARAIWAALYSVALGSSTAQYFKLQQLEAAGHAAELERAMQTLQQLEVQRAELWQQAAHDLRGSLGVVTMVTAGLTSLRAPDEAKARFLGALDRNVRSLHRLLEDVTSLARLESGQEQRVLAPLDASELLRQIAESVQAAADDRQLLLQLDGPQTLPVEGDAIKIRRIVQNLVLNAIKYTQQGGVTIAWGLHEQEGGSRWFIGVSDTGPGLHAGTSAPLTQALDVATKQASEMSEGHAAGEITHIGPAALDAPRSPAAGTTQRGHLSEGEGIGLSIVKRLCTLLDATMEVETRAGQGTTFRILLPTGYVPAPATTAPLTAPPGA
jgi:signal transduction histidine kinase